MKEMCQREQRLQPAAEVCLPTARVLRGHHLRESRSTTRVVSFTSSVSCASSASRVTRHRMPSKIVRNSLKTNESGHSYSTQKRGVCRMRKSLGERQICFGVQRRIGAFAGHKMRVARGGDHR